MEFQDVVRKRKMVRAFKPEALPEKVVQKILRNAQRGPSSGFAQGFEFLVFDGRGETSKFWKHLATQPSAHPLLGTEATNAPLIIVPLAHSKAYVRRYLEPDKKSVGRKTEQDWPAPHWFTDTAFASMLILLTAVDSNLGGFYFSIGPTSSCVSPFRKAFGVPAEYDPMGAIAIGYPAETGSGSSSATKSRRPKSEVMHFSRW